MSSESRAQPVYLDNNILSTFAKVKRLELLFTVFARHILYVTSDVYDELVAGVEHGHDDVLDALVLISKGRIKKVALSDETATQLSALPGSLARGEKSSILLVQQHNGVLVTNDQQAVKYCVRKGLLVVSLPQILRALWQERIMPQDAVRALVEEIERAEHTVIKCKEDIFTL